MEYKVKDAVREGGAVEKVEISFYSSTESQDDGYRSESESGLVVTAGVCCCCCCWFLNIGGDNVNGNTNGGSAGVPYDPTGQPPPPGADWP